MASRSTSAEEMISNGKEKLDLAYKLIKTDLKVVNSIIKEYVEYGEVASVREIQGRQVWPRLCVTTKPTMHWTRASYDVITRKAYYFPIYKFFTI